MSDVVNNKAFGTLERISRWNPDEQRQTPRQIVQSFDCPFLTSNLHMELCGRSVPAARVGGDLFEFIHADASRLTILVGDAAGHGAGAAMLCSEVQMWFRPLAGKGHSPRKILEPINNIVARSSYSDRFVTMIVIAVDLEAGTLTYAGAGHPGYLLRHDGTVTTMEAENPPIGIVEDIEIEESPAIPLAAGDRLLLFTDGYSEATNERDEMLGDAAVVQQFLQCSEMSLQEATAQLHTLAMQHCGATLPADDMTLVTGLVRYE